MLDQLGRTGHLDARAAHQFKRTGIYVGNIGDGALRRILHGHPVRSAQKFAQAGQLLRPTGIRDLRAGDGIQHAALDTVHQPGGFAFGGDEVVPAAGNVPARFETEYAIGEGIALMVIEEQPAVELLATQLPLNFGEIHGCWAPGAIDLLLPGDFQSLLQQRIVFCLLRGIRRLR